MSALTQESLHVAEVEMTPAEVEEDRRCAEKILGRKVPPRSTTVAAGKRSHQEKPCRFDCGGVCNPPDPIPPHRTGEPVPPWRVSERRPSPP